VSSGTAVGTGDANFIHGMMGDCVRLVHFVLFVLSEYVFSAVHLDSFCTLASVSSGICKALGIHSQQGSFVFHRLLGGQVNYCAHRLHR
jgi:hypothetical protein